ncbi:unnamed protein product, partial [Meganyctiphanes norvegica]
DECHNYIRVLAKQREGHFLVCGTNSYKPLCREYLRQADGNLMIYESSGVGKCPFNPRDNSTYVFTDGALYSGTVADFQGVTPIIFREPIKTDHTDYKQLNEPDFVHSFEYGDYVWFFFHETAIEYMNCGKRRFSRVARVCKNDEGGASSRHASSWTSFLKSRLNCSMPGSHPFYFDEIQSTSDVISGIYGDKKHDIIYAVFTTPHNSIAGSAVCAFSMQDILKTFEGQFKKQETMNSNWLPVHYSKVPKQRPGQCVNDSHTLPESHINFIEAHPLMDQAVPAFFGQPVMIKTSFRYRFSKLAVDPGVRLMGGGTIDVLFIATDVGVIFKVINAYSSISKSEIEPVIIEELQVTNRPIINLQLAKGPDDAHSKLIIITDIEVKSIELQRCARTKTCKGCVGLQDPYCGWFDGAGRCGLLTERMPGPIYQNVTSGVHYHCEKEIIKKHKSKHQSVQPIQSIAPTLETSSRPILGSTLDLLHGPSLGSLSSLPANTPTGPSCSPCVCSKAPPPTPVVTPAAAVSTDAQLIPIVKQETGYLELKEKYLRATNKISLKYIPKPASHNGHILIHEAKLDESFIFEPLPMEDVEHANQNTRIRYTFVEEELRAGDIPDIDTKYVDIYTEETLMFAIIVSCLASLVVGFISGFLFSRNCEEKEVEPIIPYHDPNCNRLKNEDSSSDLTSLNINNQVLNNKINFQTLHKNVAPNNITKNDNWNNTNMNTDDELFPRKVKSVYI